MSITCYFSSLCVYAIIGTRKNQNIFSEVMNMNFIKKNWKGVLLCLMIAIPSWILGKIFPIVGLSLIHIYSSFHFSRRHHNTINYKLLANYIVCS